MEDLKQQQPDIEKQIIDVFKGMPERFTIYELSTELKKVLGCYNNLLDFYANPFKEKEEEKYIENQQEKTKAEYLKEYKESVQDAIGKAMAKIEASNQKPSELFCKGGWDWMKHTNPNEKIIDAIEIQHLIDLLKSKGYKITKTTEL